MTTACWGLKLKVKVKIKVMGQGNAVGPISIEGSFSSLDYARSSVFTSAENYNPVRNVTITR